MLGSPNRFLTAYAAQKAHKVVIDDFVKKELPFIGKRDGYYTTSIKVVEYTDNYALHSLAP